MIAKPRHVFADTAFWIALAVKQDHYHERAQQWSAALFGTMTTTTAVLLETANALSRPAWRHSAVALIDHLRQRTNIVIAPVLDREWERGWELYTSRMDKGWSLTDCMSFLVMSDRGLSEALTPDEHFRQAGFRALMLEDPT